MNAQHFTPWIKISLSIVKIDSSTSLLKEVMEREVGGIASATTMKLVTWRLLKKNEFFVNFVVTNLPLEGE